MSIAHTSRPNSFKYLKSGKEISEMQTFTFKLTKIDISDVNKRSHAYTHKSHAQLSLISRLASLQCWQPWANDKRLGRSQQNGFNASKMFASARSAQCFGRRATLLQIDCLLLAARGTYHLICISYWCLRNFALFTTYFCTVGRALSRPAKWYKSDS